MSNAPYDFELAYTFADDRLADLDRQAALLLSTREGTMPLDRSFGISMDFLDLPAPLAKSTYAAEVTEKVPKFIPALRVQEIQWEHAEAGKLIPKVVFSYG
nr:MAG TPA_asm: Regulator of RpoS, Anti-adapter protein regulator, ClpXP adaptor, anti-adaptor.0A [Caudoviricetes sp.]DAL43894.1 MAG TPA_asm: Regulator of RpoS, Anti-adapter protein regulator, ClpXP adaptor, anti-adaptor.0A [Caudoviricetes sp.]